MSRAEELVATFDDVTGNYKREEMEEALTLREEITPLLLAILDDLAAEPERYAAGNHHAEIYAVALLAHFRETRAHLPIIRAFSIPDEQREYLWSDMLTETLPALLCRTSGGDYTQILKIVRNRDAYEFLRSSAMEAIKLGVACGDLSREEGIALFAKEYVCEGDVALEDLERTMAKGSCKQYPCVVTSYGHQKEGESPE